MRKAIIVGVLMFIAFPALALSLMPPPPQLGVGQIPCFEWTLSRKKASPEAKQYTQWVLGYFSGWRAARRPGQKNIHLNEGDELLRSVDDRCASRPGSYVTYELEDLLHSRFDGKP